MMILIGPAIALLGIGSIHAGVELGWHWMFVPIGAWTIFAGGIVDGWLKRDRLGDE